MKNNNLLMMDVSEQLYDKLAERASKESISISESISRHLENSFLENGNTQIKNIESHNPLESEDFVQLIVWMYQVERGNSLEEHKLEDVEYYYNIIDKHIGFLDFDLMSLFVRLHEDLRIAISEYEVGTTRNIELRFHTSYNYRSFDFKAFEKFIKNRMQS